MNPVRISCVRAVLAFLLVSVPVSVLAQEGDQPTMSPEAQAEMAAWMKLAQPGAHHEHLAPFVGTWKGEVKMWMAPDAPPMVNQTITEASWILGERFLLWKQSGDFEGMPFEGMAIEGYNNGEKRSESLWIDYFGTLMLLFKGSCSDDGKVRGMATQFADVVGGGTIDYRTEYRWIDKDHFTYSAFMDRGDGEFKNLVITYERQ